MASSLLVVSYLRRMIRSGLLISNPIFSHPLHIHLPSSPAPMSSFIRPIFPQSISQQRRDQETTPPWRNHITLLSSPSPSTTTQFSPQQSDNLNLPETNMFYLQSRHGGQHLLPNRRNALLELLRLLGLQMSLDRVPPDSQKMQDSTSTRTRRMLHRARTIDMSHRPRPWPTRLR